MEEYNVIIVVVIVVVVVVIIHARHRHLYRIQSRDVSDRGIVLFLSGLVLSGVGILLCWYVCFVLECSKVVRYLPQKVVCLMNFDVFSKSQAYCIPRS